MTSEFYYGLNDLLGTLNVFLDPNSDYNAIRLDSRTSSSSSFFLPILIAPQDRTIPIEIQTKLQAEERRKRDLENLEAQVKRQPSLLPKYQDEIQALRLAKDESILDNYVSSKQEKDDERKRATAMNIFTKLTEMSYKPYTYSKESGYQMEQPTDVYWTRCEKLQETAKQIESLTLDITKPNQQQRIFESKVLRPSPADLRTLPTWGPNNHLQIPMIVEAEKLTSAQI